MRSLRLIVRLIALSVATFLSFAVVGLGNPIAWCVGRLSSWRTLVTHWWARSLVAILGMRVNVQGERPSGPFLLVSNHLSYVDIFLLASRMRCSFVAKGDVRRWPAMGLIAATAGTVFVERGRKRDVVPVGEAIRARLEQGAGLVLFPEGTSTAGESVAEFRSALLEPAARFRLPVRYASIRYQTPPGEPPAHETVSWWGDMTLRPHLFDLLQLPWFEASIVFGHEPVHDTDRKALARRLHSAVSDQFVPMSRERIQTSYG